MSGTFWTVAHSSRTGKKDDSSPAVWHEAGAGEMLPVGWWTREEAEQAMLALPPPEKGAYRLAELAEKYLDVYVIASETEPPKSKFGVFDF